MALDFAPKVIAKSPPTVAMVIGAVLIMSGNTAGWLAFLIGAALNALWIVA